MSTVKTSARGYAYRAHLEGRGGRLKYITAGCRKWDTWKSAFAHYEPSNPNDRWGKNWVGGDPMVEENKIKSIHALVRLRHLVKEAQARKRKRNAK